MRIHFNQLSHTNKGKKSIKGKIVVCSRTQEIYTYIYMFLRIDVDLDHPTKAALSPVTVFNMKKQVQVA
jgi:hypothetical protein